MASSARWHWFRVLGRKSGARFKQSSSTYPSTLRSPILASETHGRIGLFDSGTATFGSATCITGFLSPGLALFEHGFVVIVVYLELIFVAGHDLAGEFRRVGEGRIAVMPLLFRHSRDILRAIVMIKGTLG